jgi:Ca2+-binding RTX toxin-like protein
MTVRRVSKTMFASLDATTGPTEGNDILNVASGQTVDGLGGDDRISGSTGSQTLIGGSGNDTLIGSYDSDMLIGGVGDDQYIFDDNSGQDVIVNFDTSSAKNDVIILTNVSEDQLFATGYGVFRIGNDWIMKWTGGGQVTLKDAYLGADHQVTELRMKKNLSQTEDVTFTMREALERYAVQLTDGDDILGPSDLSEKTNAGAGNDRIDMGAGNDNVNGQAGNDTLDGGTGNDLLTGSLGDDVIILRGGDGNDTVSSADSTVGRTDTLRFSDIASTGITGLTRIGNDLVLRYGTSDQVTLLSNFTSPTGTVTRLEFSNAVTWGMEDLYAAYSIRLTDADDNIAFPSNLGEFVYAGAGNDIIDARSGNDKLYGEIGNDSLIGNIGTDTLYGGDGTDTLIGGTDNDTLFGDGGNDSLSGDAGDDSLNGGAGNDDLKGLAGNDFFDGGIGNDTMNGGGGNDTFVLRVGSGQDTIALYDNTTVGKLDVIRFEDVASTQLTSVTRAGNNLTISYGSSDSVTLTNYYADAYSKFSTIEFSDGTSFRSDQLFARHAIGLGSLGDTMTFTDDVETVHGAAGNDVLQGMGGSDALYGEADNDNLAGGTGNDILSGGDGNDTLTGSEGDDLLDGGIGNDTLTTGTGNDVVLLRAGAGVDSLNLSDATTDRVKTVVFEGINATDIGSLQRVGNSLVLNYTATDQVTVTNFFGGPTNFADKLVFADRTWTAQDLLNNREIGLSGVADAMVFTLLDETVKAGAGNDSITGGAGRDRLYGELGNDTLNGGADDDELFGGDGLDSLLGSTGNDTIDGELGVDTVQGEAGEDVLRGGGGNDSLDGGLGNDRLDGGTENDALTGGAGNDTYVFHRGSGNDTVNAYDSGAARVETVLFDDIVATQLTAVVRSGNNLVLSYGTADKVTVTSQFTSAAYAVNGFQFADGHVYTAADLQALSLGTAVNAGADATLIGVAPVDMFA